MGRGKRSATIVISSSEDDEDKQSLLKTSVQCSASEGRRKNCKRTKKGLISNSCTRLSQHSDFHGFDEVKRFCKEFDQGFTQFQVSSGSEKNQDLWVDKYKPTSLEQLAVHKKKVEEVKIWFEDRLKNSYSTSYVYMLLVAGQAGAGKSATIHAVASHLGADVCEWNAPTPTLWQEHLHASNSGIRYMSKLDEFESFVERIGKYGSVLTSLTCESWRPVILLIDDLPAVNGKVAYGRLHRCLLKLLHSVCIPTALLISDYGKSDPAEHHKRYWEELQSSLHNAGACKVAFNPITVNSIRKVLSKICKLERVEVNSEHIEQIAKASGGDVRHAITSLQYFSLKSHPRHSLCATATLLSKQAESKGKITTVLDDFVSLPYGKDENLPLFHALGKFLHNKRDIGSLVVSDGDDFLLKEKYVRSPLKMDSPELVLCQANVQARLVADFLHENVLDFVSEEALDDALVVATYLSDADLLLFPLSRTFGRSFQSVDVIHSAAASIAVRGVLFGNTHPESSRWHAIRRPKLWQAEHSLQQNKCHLVSQEYLHLSKSLTGTRLSVFATEFRPAFNWLEQRTHREDDILNEAYGSSVSEDDDDIEDDW